MPSADMPFRPGLNVVSGASNTGKSYILHCLDFVLGAARFSEEIEEALRQHPAVMEAAVVGFNSADWGEAVKAFVVLHRDVQCSADTLIGFCKGALASYKAPKLVEFVATLPRTDLGKIDRFKLAMMNRENR